MSADSSLWRPDHNAQVKAARSCCLCGRTYTHDEVQKDLRIGADPSWMELRPPALDPDGGQSETPR